MKAISVPVWKRALDCLDDATANQQQGRYLVTVNRSYYAVFYALSALLYEQDVLTTKSHSGAQTKFRELYIKTGLLPKEASLWVDKTWELRQVGDYDFDEIITADEATAALDSARKFVDTAGTYLHQ